MESWTSRLTDQELQHVRESGSTTEDQAASNGEIQGESAFPCFQCVTIARKLGYPVNLKAYRARMAGHPMTTILITPKPVNLKVNTERMVSE